MTEIPDHLKSTPTPEEPTDRAVEEVYQRLKQDQFY